MWQIFLQTTGEHEYMNWSKSFLSSSIENPLGEKSEAKIDKHVSSHCLVSFNLLASLGLVHPLRLRARLIHNIMAARTSYNKVASRSSDPEPNASLQSDALSSLS